ncbi:MAG TPA: ankyrin repeat domain-containing protein [Vicinamibacterales bacterium]|nr:ankyrin repeat domain-containing protein [Vicinamibacterales bacterium]
MAKGGDGLLRRRDKPQRDQTTEAPRPQRFLCFSLCPPCLCGGLLCASLFESARTGDVATLTTLLDQYPDRLHARAEPYEWSLLHTASQGGHLTAVDLLLNRGLDPNTREKGDNTYAMHWAAAGGHLEVVQRLADAGGDIVGRDDDHELEVIGWASCWDDSDDEPHRAVVEFLVRRGARHHIFSAVALGLGEEVRQIVAADPTSVNSRQSRNENNRTPLHLAVMRNRREMIALLLELGADPLAVDGSGQSAAIYATAPDADLPVMERIHAMTAAELRSAARGHRPARGGPLDLLAAITLRDWSTAERLLAENERLMLPASGVLHLMAKRGDVDGTKWLLARAANPSGVWPHWDANVTPLHLAALQGHVEIARLLLDAGADSNIRDSKHDSDPRGWAMFFDKPDIVELIDAHVGKASKE